MTYLLSLFTTESPIEGSTQILCYHINDTKTIQIIRVMSGLRCHFEHVVLSEERILFRASPDSHLEVYSPLMGSMQASKTGCKLLRINEKPNPIKSLN